MAIPVSSVAVYVRNDSGEPVACFTIGCREFKSDPAAIGKQFTYVLGKKLQELHDRQELEENR